MQAQERYARAYGASADEYARVLDPTLESILRRLVELAQLRPGSRVLDLATGTGAAARIAAEAGATVVGVDISPGMIDAAGRRSTPEVRFEVADVGRLPFESRSFSAVTCGFGLSHFPEVGAALAEVLRVLDVGGLFVACSWGREGRALRSRPRFRCSKKQRAVSCTRSRESSTRRPGPTPIEGRTRWVRPDSPPWLESPSRSPERTQTFSGSDRVDPWIYAARDRDPRLVRFASRLGVSAARGRNNCEQTRSASHCSCSSGAQPRSATMSQ